MSKFNENQVLYIINLWKSDFLSIHIKSNIDKYHKMSQSSTRNVLQIFRIYK